MAPRKSTSRKSTSSTASSSTSKRKTTSSSKRKSTSSISKPKLKWVTVEEGYTEMMEGLFPEFGFNIDEIDIESSKINGIKQSKFKMNKYFDNFYIDKFLYFNSIKTRHTAEYTIVSRDTWRGDYYYFQVLFYSKRNINDHDVEGIIIDLYESKSWSDLYKKLPAALKKEINEGRQGNHLDEDAGNEHEIIWDETTPIPLKKMVKEWFALESVKEYATKKKMKKYDITTHQKKQLFALTGIEKVCYISFRKNANTKKLVILGKRKDKKYVYVHDHISKNSNEIKCEMDVEIFDSWEKVWNNLPFAIRREIG